MSAVRRLRKIARLTQSALAERAGTSQPTIAAYESRRKSPTLDTVGRLARAAGLEAIVEFHPPMTREDRRSLAVHVVIAERLERDPEGTLALARGNLDQMEEAAPAARPLLDEWRLILARPVAAIVSVLRDPDPWARELRHVSPFGGVLSAAERAAAYREFADEERRRAS